MGVEEAPTLLLGIKFTWELNVNSSRSGTSLCRSTCFRTTFTVNQSYDTALPFECSVLTPRSWTSVPKLCYVVNTWGEHQIHDVIYTGPTLNLKSQNNQFSWQAVVIAGCLS